MSEYEHIHMATNARLAEMVEKVKEEIESYKESMKGLEPHSDFRRGQITAYNQIMQFIDSLPEEHVSEDLDREIGYYTTSKLLGKRNHSTGVYHLTQKECDNIARHFAEWQRKQMMKDALSGQIYRSHDGDVKILAVKGNTDKLYRGTDIKFIILKTE